MVDDSEHIYFWSDKVSHVLLASNAWCFLNRTHSESVASAEALSQLHRHQSWGIIQITNKPKAEHLRMHVFVVLHVSVCERAIEVEKW